MELCGEEAKTGSGVAGSACSGSGSSVSSAGVNVGEDVEEGDLGGNEGSDSGMRDDDAVAAAGLSGAGSEIGTGRFEGTGESSPGGKGLGS